MNEDATETAPLSSPRRGPLRAGERAMLVDRKRRRRLVLLAEGAEVHSHAGFVAHDEIIGIEEGSTVRTTRGASYLVVRPTFNDFVLQMPRGAQVIYPKDLGAILMLADVSSGSRVLESGVGSGALSMALLRVGADVVGYELREDFARRAASNVEAYLGPEAFARYRVELRDCYEGIDEVDLDSVLLDLPEPWHVVKHAAASLRRGGTLLGYTPSTTQAAALREELDGCGFGLAETLEVMHRSWHIDGAAVRPSHRMVGHTGFLTHARFLGG